jgi:hypothetical protein
METFRSSGDQDGVDRGRTDRRPEYSGRISRRRAPASDLALRAAVISSGRIPSSADTFRLANLVPKSRLTG